MESIRSLVYGGRLLIVLNGIEIMNNDFNERMLQTFNRTKWN